MSLLPEIANPYFASLVIGFTNGLFFCTSTCLPYVAGYIAGVNADFRRGVGLTMIFNSGRVAAYALIGAIVGIFKLIINESFLSSFQTYSAYAFSAVSVAVGVILLVRNKQPSCKCPASTISLTGSRRLKDRFDVRAFTLGLSRGMILCVPLLTILAYSITLASPIESLALAILFGIGTSLSPIVLLGGATGWLLNKAPLFRKWISGLGAAALIVLGLVTLINAIII
jgi:sulfite exporter TauE/SafE